MKRTYKTGNYTFVYEKGYRTCIETGIRTKCSYLDFCKFLGEMEKYSGIRPERIGQLLHLSNKITIFA